MGNEALTLAVTLMAVDAWLVRASPCKSKYIVGFISVALKNRVQSEFVRVLMMRTRRETARKRGSLLRYIFPFTKSSGQMNGSGLGRFN